MMMSMAASIFWVVCGNGGSCLLKGHKDILCGCTSNFVCTYKSMYGVLSVWALRMVVLILIASSTH